MKKEYYPIGTVVELKETSDFLFMIIGLEVQNEAGEHGDYVAIRYPVGAMGNGGYYFFNHDQIEKVVHMGYVDSSHEAYVDLINSALNKENYEVLEKQGK